MSSLAAFYTRKISEKVADVAPPSLQLLVSFWQDEVEHVKMAARSLFHCAASRAIPLPLCSPKAKDHEKFLLDSLDISEGGYSTSKTQVKVESNIEANGQQQRSDVSEKEESELLSWLESYEMQDWISCIGATSQDAMSSHIIVAAALAVWYPSLVKPSLAKLVVHPLIKLVMAMNGTYSSAAAEILAEGMENTWKECIGSEIPRLLGDIYFQIECVSTVSTQNPAASPSIRDSLVGVLLPSLALADTFGFLNVIASQIWSTASDSPVHLVSLMTLIRIIRDSPRNVIQYLDKVVTFILQTMDHGNSVLRRTCLQSSLMALKEVVIVFPMVALNSTSTRLAVGDAIGDINNAIIRIFDTHSMTIVKILDASGPPGLPSILGGASGTGRTTAISALAFSPDGEGLVAFSETGLMIRWWSLGSVWWDKLSRNLTAVQCTKLIFVPPWEGFSSNPFRSSIMATVTDSAGEINSEEKKVDSSEIERVKLLVHNIDLSYKLEWDGEKKVKLKHQGHELGIFQL
ncbi:hypothetical protein Leryth_019324 [Lithospermum erythrorhizon]|nr:hypothetical protein Leryth_019324 [Lithospermum erythrorhizon]